MRVTSCFRRAFNSRLWAARISCSAAAGTERDRKRCWLLLQAGREKGQRLCVPPHYSHIVRLVSSHIAFINATINNQFMNHWAYQIFLYVFSICWSSVEHLTSMPFVVFTLLWTLRCWASTKWCNSNARYPHAQCSCHSWEIEPSTSRAWNERNFIKALSWDHYFIFCFAEASWEVTHTRTRHVILNCEVVTIIWLTFFIVRKYSVILKPDFWTKTFVTLPNLAWDSKSIKLYTIAVTQSGFVHHLFAYMQLHCCDQHFWFNL